MKTTIRFYILCLSLLCSASLFAADLNLQAKIDKANELEKYYQELNQLDDSNINDYKQSHSSGDFEELDNDLEKQRQQSKPPSSNHTEKNRKDAFSEMDNANKQ